MAVNGDEGFTGYYLLHLDILLLLGQKRSDTLKLIFMHPHELIT